MNCWTKSEVDQNSRCTGSGCLLSQNMLDQHRCFRGAVDACSPINDAVTSSNLTFVTFLKNIFFIFLTHIVLTIFPRLFLGCKRKMDQT